MSKTLAADYRGWHDRPVQWPGGDGLSGAGDEQTDRRD